MTGPAEWEFSGSFDPHTGEWQRDEATPSQGAA
jgi:diaminopimelate epimerase